MAQSGENFWIVGSPGELGMPVGSLLFMSQVPAVGPGWLPEICSSALRSLMSQDHSSPDQHSGGLGSPFLHPHPQSRLSGRDMAGPGPAVGRHLTRMDFIPRPGVFSSLPGFSHRPIFGLINGVNFLMIVDKYPFDFLQGNLMICASVWLCY